MSNFVDHSAELDKDGENDDGFGSGDEERDPSSVSRNRNNDDEDDDGSDNDSSEEDEEDDEEEMAKVREGFIVDDDSEEDLSDGERERRRRRRRKRRRKAREGSGEAQEKHHDDEELDEDDLDLVMENTGGYARGPASKRQKRADEGLTDIFSDEEKEAAEEQPASGRRGLMDEFAGFIEDDEFSDEEGQQAAAETGKSARPSARPGRISIPGVNEEQLGEIFEIFGDGEEYGWALEAEELEGVEDYEEKPTTELKDVFEPSELAERMLTDEDNAIRAKDQPERFQISRKAFPNYELSDAEFVLEENWIVREVMDSKKKFLDSRPDLAPALKRSIKKVLEFVVKDELEVPFIWQHRRDYLIQERKRDSAAAASAADEFVSDQFLTQDDLWYILQLDVKFHSIVEKRRNVERLLKDLDLDDGVLTEFFSNASSLYDHQDILDYIHFRYAAKLKDLSATQSAAHVAAPTITPSKRPNSRFQHFETIRSGNIYNLVRSFGITAEQFGLNFAEDKKLHFPEDPEEMPLDLADLYTHDPVTNEPTRYSTGEAAFDAAKNMFAEEIFHDLRTRNFLREKIVRALVRMDVIASDKGKKVIDETHQFYHFKYMRNLQLSDIYADPETFLEILQAESEGLVTLRFKLIQLETFLAKVLSNFTSDNTSDIASAWNKERQNVLHIAMGKLVPLMCRELREELRAKSQRAVAMECRAVLLDRLDQAPYKPAGFELGTTPRVLALSNGMGGARKDAIVCVYVDDQGRVLETLKLEDARDEGFRTGLVDIIRRRRPDVLCMAGFTISANRLRKDILDVISQENLTVGGDDDGGSEQLIELLWANDEVARLYQNSERAASEFSELAPLLRYCVALARYVQSPLLEYAAMGADIVSIELHRLQALLPEDLLREVIESAFVDMVNTVGVEINEAIKVPYVANLLQYVGGLGPRKASGMLKAISSGQNGYLNNRFELVSNEIAGKTIFMNCASFLVIPWEEQESSGYRSLEETEILDSTRIHPEDYELARKMAADALELDEEDLVDLENQGGVVAQLMDDDPEKLNELILEEYAEELLKNFKQHKRATLEMIKEELQRHYYEERHELKRLTEDQVFTMLTGETRESVAPGTVVPVNIRKVGDRYLVARMSCGIDGNVSSMDMTSRTDMPYPAALFYYGQTVRALIKSINYGTFQADLSLVEEAVEDALRNPLSVKLLRQNRDPSKWDEFEEDKDRSQFAVKREKEQRAARVIKHRLFHPFNRRQAEEFLAPLQRGDLVIRPSSLGVDHITITWKVAKDLYQHIAVHELDKESDYSLGRVLEIDNEKYSDLDELIFMHVQAKARKVEEMMNSEKFQQGTREDVEAWLTTYTQANTRRSNYAFCLDRKHPGYFELCFKAGQNSKVVTWPVKVIPNGFQLKKAVYPSVQELCNGFKMMYQASLKRR
ncbi:transcription elongation factor spt6 [Myxozyma melibiosi]|uniref:Transcription elongation factor Spt6 n=1 Tax=Myxozyma melibiosi TaxID=54550 RepID=A0ABR1FAN4_9ASCO